MEREKKARTVTRSAFTRVLTALRAEFGQVVPQVAEVQVHYAMLKDKASELEDLNGKIFDLMAESDASEDAMSADVLSADEYRAKYQQAKVEVSRVVDAAQQQEIQRPENQHQNNVQQENRRAFKLPKIELKKFSGDVKEWLQFWSQFKNIHEDGSVTKEDKFQYLIQAMVVDSRASELVNSYPPTGENYDKVITSLKNRFGKDELLVEVYVRELLKLVLNNALTPKGKVSLASLYDKLETHIRSLESLGVTTDTCAAMLYPLVESSLPEELLRAWQRHTSTAVQIRPREEGYPAPAVAVVITPKDRLTNLMAFIQAEVENEERITMAVSGFGINQEQMTKDKVKKKQKNESNNETATASALLTTKESKYHECIFCSDSHDSSQCEKARKMSLDERQDIAKQKNACFNCLKCGHARRFCKYNHKCGWCSKKHVLLMCRGMISERPAKKTADKSVEKQEESNLANLSLNTEIFLQTLRVKIRNGGKERIIRVVLDTGSHRSYVLDGIAKEMGYEEVGQQKIIHLLFGGEKTEPRQHRGYCVRISSLDDSYACNFVALDQDTICHNIPGITRGPWIEELTKRGIKLTDMGQGTELISVLIGADVAGKLLTGRIQNLECGATAIETRLGWTVMGKNSQEKRGRGDSALVAFSMFAQESKISDLWSLDVLGITDPIEVKTKEIHQEQVKKHFRQTVAVDNTGRYEVFLPWKENHPPLADNKEMAFKRLQTSTRRLKSENLFEDYGKVLDEWIEEGVIERVPPTEVNNPGYYLPHRHIVKESSTTRLRPVFDASAKGKDSPSLNQCLEIGPNLIELIPTMLLRFREKRIGVISDIRRAFLQISVVPKDRDVLRFLWWSKEDTTEVNVYRHCRVVFGVTSSPFLLGATIDLHLEKALQQADSDDQRDVIRKLTKSFYVDNCVTSVDTSEELHLFEKGATAVMYTGGFLLRGWEYSDPLSNNSSSVLGLTWDKGQDTLSLAKAALEESFPAKVTKRNILSYTQKIFDPMGLVCPVLLRPKLMLQKLWSADLDWDTEVPKEIQDAFREWHEEVKLLKSLRVPRWALGDKERGDTTSFHVFVDASQEAYAAALYARTETPEGIKVQLLEAKTRVAPLGKSTIPRLELLAATIGARLMIFTLDALGMQHAEKWFWSDSTTVLSWIKRDNQWATFVWNRVKEIRQLTKPELWCHLPGTMNPADLPSRGCSAKNLLESRWWEGPKWLKKPRDEWPSADYTVNEIEVNNEIKKSTVKLRKVEASIQCEVGMTNVGQSVTGEEECWYLKGFSKYPKILRMVAWVLRFIKKCQRNRSQNLSGNLEAKEIIDAERTLMRLTQHESFEGIDDPRISCLNPIKDKSGLIRLKTLISNRDDQFGFRYPIVLDPRHPLVTKLIQHKHEKMNHAGIQIVMSNLREQVWIISSRRAIRSVIAKCVTCKRYKATRIEAAPSTLPEERVRDAAAFEVTGIDFAGPLYLKDGTKSLVCLFTCAVYRAVHFELVSSLSTEAFLGAFRRFIARRGRPSIVFSDNGTNFTGANNLLRGINWNKIVEYSTVDKIEWRFNPPSAAWWGGWWERLVRSMKELMRKVLGRACLTYEELSTTLCDCEAIINSRPITYLSEDPDEFVPLTTAMFLQDIKEIGVPDHDRIEESDLRGRQSYRQKLRTDLRRRFRTEYLGQLSQPKKSKKNTSTVRKGDVVFVGHDNQKRLTWPLARVIEVIPGRDGEVRVVRLKTANGELVRPIQRLYPLEMTSPIEVKAINKAAIENGSSKKESATLEEQNSSPPPEESTETASNKEEMKTGNHTRSGRQINAPKRLNI